MTKRKHARKNKGTAKIPPITRFFAIIMVFVGLGITLVLIIRAATQNVAFEAENGSRTSNVTLSSDTNASGGQYIQFAPSTGGPVKPFNTDGTLTGTWNLKFQDEFDGSGLNTSFWSTGWLGSGVTPPVQSQELACYDPAQVSVSGGLLHLNAIVKAQTCGGKSRPYTSGAVNSSGKKEFAGGYFEARVWLDAASTGAIANWPAWWLDGHNWPNTGELDIMEGLSGNARGNWHGPEGGGAGHSIGGDGHATGWHIFAAEWVTNQKVSAYYDGVKLGTYSSTTNITAAPQFLILGEQIGPENQYGGPVKVPSHMDIDYVRVWQR